MTEEELKQVVQEAKAREALNPHHVAGEYERPDEPAASDRWLVRCACGKGYRGSTRGIAFAGWRRHRESAVEDFEPFDDIDWTDPEVRAQLWADSMVLRELINSGLVDAETAAEVQIGLAR